MSPTPPTPQAGPFTPEHQMAMVEARRARKPLDRVVKIATFSATSLAVFAAISLLFSFSSWKGAFVANGLLTCAYFEFKGRNALRRLDEKGVTTLMWNKVGLAALIAVYCGWCMLDAAQGKGGYAEVVAEHPELTEALGPYEDLIERVTLAAYGVVLLVSLGVQAIMVAYYRRTMKRLSGYLRNTPEWVRAIDVA